MTFVPHGHVFIIHACLPGHVYRTNTRSRCGASIVVTISSNAPTKRAGNLATTPNTSQHDDSNTMTQHSGLSQSAACGLCCGWAREGDRESCVARVYTIVLSVRYRFRQPLRVESCTPCIIYYVYNTKVDTQHELLHTHSDTGWSGGGHSSTFTCVRAILFELQQNVSTPPPPIPLISLIPCMCTNRHTHRHDTQLLPAERCAPGSDDANWVCSKHVKTFMQICRQAYFCLCVGRRESFGLGEVRRLVLCAGAERRTHI